MAAYEFKIDPDEFDGKRALVTGASKGIGQAVAARLREGGARGPHHCRWAAQRSC